MEPMQIEQNLLLKRNRIAFLLAYVDGSLRIILFEIKGEKRIPQDVSTCQGRPWWLHTYQMN
jgi:hypothetical protein